VTRTELLVPVEIAAPAAVVWEVVTDWERQGEWILGTRVTVPGPDDGRRLGARFSAFTGIGPVGFTDPMEVVEWDPPRRCVVTHLGRVVRGDGVFEVTELGPERSQFLWSERLELPLGALGRLGWPLVRPAFRAGVAWSLRRLAGLCEARYRAGAAGEPGVGE
jgi:Polyketide cyclase / dehydrase and lipid transport